MNNRRAFIIGIKSTKLSLKEKIFIKRYKHWGIILFTRNIKSIRQINRIFDPEYDNEQIDRLYANWQKAVKRSMNWSN